MNWPKNLWSLLIKIWPVATKPALPSSILSFRGCGTFSIQHDPLSRDVNYIPLSIAWELMPNALGKPSNVIE